MLVLAGVSLAVAGCDFGKNDGNGGIIVTNGTTSTIQIETLGDNGQTYKLGPPIAPGETSSEVGRGLLPDSRIAQSGCMINDLVARDPQDTEVARREPPVCDHQTWTVTAASPTSS